MDIGNKIEQKLEREGLVIVENLSKNSWAEFNKIIHDELSTILELSFEDKTENALKFWKKYANRFELSKS